MQQIVEIAIRAPLFFLPFRLSQTISPHLLWNDADRSPS